MSSTFNALLSDIYRLLSLYDEDDFVSAAQSYRVDPLIRDVLRTFAKSAHDARSAGKRSKIREAVEHLRQPDSQEAPDINGIIFRALGAGSLEKVLEVFARSGITFAKRPKESKERLAKRLSTILGALPPSRRRKVLDDLAEIAGGQTAGWISVLRNRS